MIRTSRASRAILAAAGIVLAAAVGFASASGHDARKAGIAHPKEGRYAGIGENKLRFGFDVDGGEVRDPEYSHVYGGGCSAGGSPTATSPIDGHGRYSLDPAPSMIADLDIPGRFTSRNKAKGTLDFEATPASGCPGTYERAYGVARIGKGIASSGSGSGNPKKGRYAGAGKRMFIWLDVAGGVVSNVRVNPLLPSCYQSRPLGDDDAPPDGAGFFSLSVSDPPDEFFLQGQFKNRTQLRGKLVWTTTSNCPSGAHEFPYRAKLMQVPDGG